jgi:hypothetical protein
MKRKATTVRHPIASASQSRESRERMKLLLHNPLGIPSSGHHIQESQRPNDGRPAIPRPLMPNYLDETSRLRLTLRPFLAHYT